MIKAVIFDWGGVIAPIPGGGWLGVLADKLGKTVEEILPYWRTAGYRDLSCGNIDETEFLRRFEISYCEALPDDTSQIWIEGSALDPWLEMMEFVKQLKNNNYKVGLLSNTVKAMSNAIIQKNFYKDFEPLILSDVVGSMKPELNIYQKVLDELQLSANECIYVDDSQKNLEPAKELGMVTVLASVDPKETIASIQLALK